VGAPHLYDGSTYTTLDDPLATNGTVINGINDAGQIVGSYTDGTGSHAFFADTSFSTVAEIRIFRDHPNCASFGSGNDDYHCGQDHLTDESSLLEFEL
jgi:hypothetical protein